MKRIPVIEIVAALAAGITLLVQTVAAQTAGASESGFYRPLTQAPAEAEAVGGGGDAGGQAGTEALAKAAQNPIAKMISVPFQNNFNFGIGPSDATQWDLNIEPVIPIELNENWNLITRTIIRSSTSPRPHPVWTARSVWATSTHPSISRPPSRAG